MFKFLRAGVLALGLGVAATALAQLSHEPANLDQLKAEISDYVDSGAYDRDISAVAATANAWLDQRAKQGGARLTVVFDLDETLWSNLPLIRKVGYGYVPKLWGEWVDQGEAPAIEPVRGIFRRARQLGLDVILLSGRRERERSGTEKNLRVIGCSGYVTLILKPDDAKGSTGAFKLAERRRLQAEGRTIIANIGDQESDFEGGAAERKFKLPSPFYITR